MPVKPLVWPEPCTGPHELTGHDHAWWAGIDPKFRSGRECLGRFRCRKCWRWVQGEACKPAARTVSFPMSAIT